MPFGQRASSIHTYPRWLRRAQTSFARGISVESHAEELAELLFFEDLDDVIAVGTSTGGMVLCRLAELARERIGKVVFTDALALFDGEALPDIVTRKNAVTTEYGTGPTDGDLKGRLFADLRDDVRDWASARSTRTRVR